MDEETETKTAPFDAELEIIKLQGRFRWLVNELEEFRQKDRSLSARISRLKLSSLEDEDDEDLEVEEARVRSKSPPRLEDLSLEQRALLLAKLTDRE